MGWSLMDSVFLGGMLASSSTTIIKAFDELGMKTRRFANIVFGILIIEDIVVIMLMVLLSTVAVTRQFEGEEMLFTVGKLLFFPAIWFFPGIFLIPTLLKTTKKILDDETLLVLSVGLCLGMVVFAVSVGFSAELGAFIMESIFAETVQAEKIQKIFAPVRDLFASIFFFVSGHVDKSTNNTGIQMGGNHRNLPYPGRETGGGYLCGPVVRAAAKTIRSGGYEYGTGR